MYFLKLWAKARIGLLTFIRQLKQTAIDPMITNINCRWLTNEGNT